MQRAQRSNQTRILWLGRDGVLQIQRSTGDFLRIFLGSSHCWFCEHAGHQVQGLHSPLPAVVRRHCRSRPGARLSGRGPTRGPFSSLLTGPQRRLHCGTKHTGEGAPWHSGWGNLGELGCSGANHCSGTREQVSPCPSCWVRLLSQAQSAGARWVPLSSPGQGALPESVCSLPPAEPRPVLPRQTDSGFPNILFSALTVKLLYLRV